jgi:hypothetical protein
MHWSAWAVAARSEKPVFRFVTKLLAGITFGAFNGTLITLRLK